MKKQAIIFCLGLLASFSIQAQVTSMTSKNGHEILPQEGDYCISMDAVPLVNMAMNAINIMNDSGNNGVHPNYVSGFEQTIVGKMYTSATTADRIRLNINHRNMSMSTFAPTFDDNGEENGETEDVEINRSTQLLFGYGKEMRRGHNRLQGFYGYEGMLAIGMGANKFNYESELADGATRTLSAKQGFEFGLGVRGFVGAEYFFAPKMSIGAEFGWGLGISRTGRGSLETETNTAGDIETTETDGASSEREWGFEVDNGIGSSLLGGGTAALTLNLHF